jgi:hypothetical protein
MKGWVSIHRTLVNHPLWIGEKFTRGQAWVDLILLANHAEGYLRVRGVRIDVMRGQVGWSEVALAKRWRWSRGKVKRFFIELENDKQIVQQKNNVTSIISIVNYNIYQQNESTNSTVSDTTNDTTKKQQTDTKQDTNNNANNGKNDKKVNNKDAGLKKPDFINQIISIFSDMYTKNKGVEYYITNQGKERSLASKLLQFHKAKCPEATTEETLIFFRNFFQSCLNIKDDWHSTKMSINHICSNLNQLINIIRNGTNKGSNKKIGGASNEELAHILAKHFAEDYPHRGEQI